MPSVLIVSESEGNIALFSDAMPKDFTSVTVKTTAVAAAVLADTGFDYLLCDTEDRVDFLSSRTLPVPYVLSVGKKAEELSTKGIYQLEKPEKKMLAAFFEWSRVFHLKEASLEKENTKLHKKIDDMSLINRAKLLLMKTLGFTENQAYKYIEKQAMDLRLTKSEVAGRVLSTYES